MRYVQINSFYNGSTGTIMRNLHRELTEQGVDSYIFWGRRHATISDHEQCCATKLGVYSHGVKTRAFGRAGFYSKGDTLKLLARLDEIQPDVVHLHNIHGYYINVEMLFEWLAKHEEVQVRWTLHDCWAFTGHCAHFQYVGCDRWHKGACGKGCPQLDAYPKTVCRSSCRWNFVHKQACFTRLPIERMTIITPSNWLKGLVRQSFLSKYSTEVRHNSIDTSVFKPTPSDFRERWGIGNRLMILGVASPWTERKGLGDFIGLADELDPKLFAIVVVGLSRRQLRAMPKGVIGLCRTESASELAAIYAAADVFFNPSREDNYPTVNLEAEACGTRVVTFDTGGASETISRPDSMVIESLQDFVAYVNDIGLIGNGS